jgi:ribose transport system ATP-binding protein
VIKITSRSAGTLWRTSKAASLAGVRDELLLVVLILIAIAAFTLARPSFLALENLLNIGQQSAIVAVVAFGMTGVIIAREIDISVGGTMASAGIVAAMVVNQTGSGVLGFLAALCVGAFFGGVNAMLVAGLGISSFVASLGTMALAKGAALSISHASSVLVTNEGILWAGQSRVLGIPTGLLIALLLCAGWTFLLKRTVLGKSIYAVGGNALAAQASLISVKKTQTTTYMLCGASAGIAAIMGIGRLGSAQPLAGTGLEFAAITAAVVGGASLAGGKGSVAGTMLGAIAIGTINSGLSFLEVSQQVIYMVSGVLILVAVLARGGLPWTLMVMARRDTEPRVKPDERTGTTRSLKVTGVSKQFGSVRVLRNISFELGSSEVVALMGENGAGKSTVVKCMSGVHSVDEGSIVFCGAYDVAGDVAHTQDIAVIHQHFSLVPDLTIAESLSLGREPVAGFWLNRAVMRRRASKALNEVGLACSVDTPVRQLTVGQRQMLEVAKALMASAWLVVMDEPTSALSNRERDQLYTIIGKLKAKGCCVLYISHKMEEVRALASRAIVLRDGTLVGDVTLDDITERELVHLMVGRDLGNVFPWSAAPLGSSMIEVNQLSGGLLRDVSLSVRAGEVVGIAGLMGSGRSDILRCIAGIDRHTSGEIRLQGETLKPGDQTGSAKRGVAFIPEDRHLEGIVGGLSIAENLGLVWMRRNNRAGAVSRSAQSRMAVRMIKQLDIRPPVSAKLTGTLSGGNQQKVVIGKWLAVNPAIVLLDEPTSGVDVGAKSEIHKVIGELKTAGAAILLVSSELPELLGVSDRIVVIRDGRSVGELPRGASEREVMELAFGSITHSQAEVAT